MIGKIFLSEFLILVTHAERPYYIHKSFGNSWGNSYIPCLQVIITYRFTCGERKICQNIKKSQNIMKVVVGLFILYLCDLFFILSLIFVVSCHITSFKQTYLHFVHFLEYLILYYYCIWMRTLMKKANIFN